MQDRDLNPLRIVLPGRYFDSRVYRGRLYLWDMDGSLRVFNWNRLLDSLAIEPRLRLALECGFKRSDWLYGASLGQSVFFLDDEIRTVLFGKFADLARSPIEVTRSQLQRAEVKIRGKALPFPHSGCLLYAGRLHVCSPEGVVSTGRHHNGHPDFSRLDRRWDCPVVGLSAGYGSLALSAGNEGLWELSTTPEEPFDIPRLLTPFHSSSSHWTFFSIFSSSHEGAGYLVDFDLQKPSRSAPGAGRPADQDWRLAGMLAEPEVERHSERSYRALLREEELFHHASFSWGLQEKLCQVTAGEVRIIRYSPWGRQGEERFEPLGRVPFASFPDESPIAADSALFGFLLEFDEGLLVLKSTGEELYLPGEPVNWRVFPRSRHYENQLHVVREDHLDIYSFNDDYLVDQKSKLAGIEYHASGAGRFAASAVA
jgi:hypothetical protein